MHGRIGCGELGHRLADRSHAELGLGAFQVELGGPLGDAEDMADRQADFPSAAHLRHWSCRGDKTTPATVRSGVSNRHSRACRHIAISCSASVWRSVTL